jgi:hypothetical protein
MKIFVRSQTTMPLRRRAVPFAFAFLVGASIPLLLASGWIDEPTANEATLFQVALVFLLKSIIFAWMRHLMLRGKLPLTRFGTALVDFFTALVALDIAITGFFGWFWFSLNQSYSSPRWVLYVLRSGMAGTGALTAATVAAVAYEITRVGGGVSVHREDESPGDSFG